MNDVSPGNPCPFLRALVSQGLLPDGGASLGEVTQTIRRVAATGDGSPDLPAVAIRAIALIANGLGPFSLARNATSGVRLNELRNGPLDKKGAGSGILDSQARVVDAELKRLATFASNKTDASGRTELGLSLDELTTMMDANFERAAGRRRAVDRRLMDGEWPVLLKVLGKEGPNGRYLAVADVNTLIKERRLPARMAGPLKKGA
ncbi:hypothetical protein AACH06_24795 [Ideonella sp. DXS29W]|uniref:Uncharacterized protein n=1 Tax=Ideonella lacteola TaxID=2984193 RepID=A0ABU9BZP8_9BURK